MGQNVQVRFLLLENPSSYGPIATSTVTLVGPPPPPMLDLNGDAPGEDYATTYYVDGANVPLVDPTGLTVQDTGSLIREADVTVPFTVSSVIGVDTTGTNIHAVQDLGNLRLTGQDTAEHYQRCCAR